jgi:hypothetical protein
MTGRRIYLAGSTGYPNYGDELVAAQWLRYLARHEPDAEVWLDSPNPGGATLLHRGLHPNVHFVDTLFRVAWTAPSDEPEEVVGYADEAVRTLGFGVPHRARGIEILQSADVFHVIGGAYLNSIWPRHVALLAAGAALAGEFGTQVSATGQSLLPVAGSGGLLDRLTAGYRVVDVRDDASRELLSGGNVEATGDDALLDVETIYDDRDSRSVMMCFQSDQLDGDVEAMAESARATAEAWGVDGEGIGYVEGIPGQDRIVFDLLSESLPGMRFYPFTEIWDAGVPARRGQRWMTSRSDLHLVAAAAGAWGVAFPGKAGYSDVAHRDLVDRGSRWVIGTPGEPAPEVHGDNGFGSALAPQVEAKRKVAQTVYAR